MNRNYVIIVGAMKSGTTTLFDVLAEHPEIAPASNKEPGFFAFEEVWSKGFKWFDTLFDFDPARHRYRMEASTDYTKEPFVTGVWERMTSNPDVQVKLLYIMRHPLRRIESHARHVQGARKEVGQRITEQENHSLDAGLSPVNLITSQYATQLEAFGEAKAAGLLHCLTLEELRDDPEKTLRAVYAFLDLEPANLELTQSNAAGTRTQVNQSWKKLTRLPLVTGLAKILPGSLRQALRDKFRSSKVKTEGRFKLTTDEESALAQLFLADIEALKTKHGIDVSRWNIGDRR